MPLIGIVNYRLGNLASLGNALRFLGASVRLCTDGDEFRECAGLVLPGVGSFPEGMANLRQSGLDEAVTDFARSGRPMLGICLGMQLLAETGEEFAVTPGLGLIPGRVRRLDAGSRGLRLPHVGWNDVDMKDCRLTRGVPSPADFYFVHSYAYDDPDADCVRGVCTYGERIVALVERDNVSGVQFHPEKSQRAGLAVLNNFIRSC